MSIIAKHLCNVEFLSDSTSETIGNAWKNIAINEDEKNNMIVAFSIPKGSGLIEKIETLIQKELRLDYKQIGEQ